MIDTALLSFTCGADLVTALNPCGSSFLPDYLTLAITGSGPM